MSLKRTALKMFNIQNTWNSGGTSSNGSAKKGIIMKVHRIHTSQFPYYLKAYRVIRENDQKVFIHSDIHVNKIVEMPDTWSLDYPYDRLHGRVMEYMISAYGLRLDPTSYS